MTRRKNKLKDSTSPKTPQVCPDFDEAVELFIKEQKILNRTPQTLTWHRECLHVLKKAFKEQDLALDLSSITPRHLKNNFILYAMEAWRHQPSSINNRLKCYRSFWRFLTKEGYVKKDITKNIDTQQEKKKVIITLDDSDIDKMFSMCNKKTFCGLRDYTILNLLLDTGIRLKELVALKLEDIYFKEELIRADGKGQKERFVPLSPEMKKILKQYLGERGELNTNALFVTLDDIPISRRTVQERLERITKKTGITKRTSPHTWRHTFAKYYILSGGDPFSLKKILGHSDWAMVHRYVDMFTGDVVHQHKKFSPLKHL